VRVVLTHHLADDARRFPVRLPRDDPEFVHPVEDPALNRLQPIADVGDRPAADDAHRVVDVGLLHLLFDERPFYPLHWIPPPLDGKMLQ